MRSKFLLLLIPLSILLTLFAKYNLNFAEFYALNIYPFFLKTWGALSFKTHNSLAELIIVAVFIILLFLTVYTILMTVKYKTFKYIKKYALNLLSFFSVTLFLFVLFCGINYYRYEFTKYSGLEIQKSSKEELIGLCELLIEDANKTREKLNENEYGTIKLFDNYYGTAQRAKNSMSKLSEKYEVLEGNFPLPKPVNKSIIMSRLGITGMFFPFTFEANVNVHIPPYEIPSVMLHELVHLRGFMREDETNFIAYLASIDSGYDDYYYSGTMMALTHSMNALFSEDYDEFVKLYNTYSEGVKKDMEFSRNYWKQFDTKVAEISNKVNDVYLKANNQVDGVKSYGRMVDLLLAYERKKA